MTNTHLLLHFLRHLFIARDEHSIHSPFIFDLYTTCFRNKSHYYAFEQIEAERKHLLASTDSIMIHDLGAGSQLNKNRTRGIKEIAKNSLTPAKQAQQLFRMILFLKPSNIIEFGSSLGITTAYLAAANHRTTVYTMEGCPHTAAIAKTTYHHLQLHNIQLLEGDFTPSLATLADTLEHFDMVYIDGNHSYHATIEYFMKCLTKSTEQSCFIFDDIYWSPGMTKAWDEIRHHPQVMLSIDTFYFGICFFRKGQPKQHFTLR